MVGIFIAIAVVFSLLAFAGYSFSKKLYAERGTYPIGGPNGGGASKFIRTHPTVQAVYDRMGRGGNTEQLAHQLLQLGAKAVITNRTSNGMLVLMEEAAIAFGNTGSAAYGTEGQLFHPMTNCLKYIRREEIKVRVEAGSETTKTKGKSVIGSALVGSVVAGGVGAVVGAIAATNHNTNNREITTIKYETIGTGVETAYLEFADGPGKVFLHNIYVADDIRVPKDSIYFAVRSIISAIESKDYHKATPVEKTKTEKPKEAEPKKEVVQPIDTAKDEMAELHESILLAFLAEHPCSTIDEIMAGLSYLPLQKVDFLKLIRHLIGDTIERVDRDGKVMFKLK